MFGSQCDEDAVYDVVHFCSAQCLEVVLVKVSLNPFYLFLVYPLLQTIV